VYIFHKRWCKNKKKRSPDLILFDISHRHFYRPIMIRNGLLLHNQEAPGVFTGRYKNFQGNGKRPPPKNGHPSFCWHLPTKRGSAVFRSQGLLAFLPKIVVPLVMKYRFQGSGPQTLFLYWVFYFLIDSPIYLETISRHFFMQMIFLKTFLIPSSQDKKNIWEIISRVYIGRHTLWLKKKKTLK